MKMKLQLDELVGGRCVSRLVQERGGKTKDPLTLCLLISSSPQLLISYVLLPVTWCHLAGFLIS